MIYTQDIKDGVAFLATLLDGVTIESADAQTVRTAEAAAVALSGRLDEGMTRLDADMSGGLEGIISGAFAPESATAIMALAADFGQAVVLADMRGYAGRVLLAIDQAGGLQ